MQARWHSSLIKQLCYTVSVEKKNKEWHFDLCIWRLFFYLLHKNIHKYLYIGLLIKIVSFLNSRSGENRETTKKKWLTSMKVFLIKSDWGWCGSRKIGLFVFCVCQCCWLIRGLKCSFGSGQTEYVDTFRPETK